MSRKPIAQFPWLFRAAEKVLLAAPILVPLFFLPAQFPFAAPKAFLINALALLVLGLLGSLMLTDRAYVPRVPKVFAVLGLYMAWLVVTSMTAVSPNAAWWSTFDRGAGMITFLGIIILALAALAVMQKKDIRANLTRAIAWGGILLVASKYIQVLLPRQTAIIGEGGTLGNSSFAGAYLLFPLAAAIYLFLTETARGSKIRWSLAALFMLSSPFYMHIFFPHTGMASWLGDARAAAISITIGTAGGFLLWLSHAQKKYTRYLANILSIAAFAALSIGAILFFRPHSVLQEKFNAAAAPTRQLYSQIAEIGISARPILGWGTNNFPFVYQTYFDPISLTDAYLHEGWVDRPHNLLLEIAANTGLPGLALYLVFYGSLLLAASYGIRKGYFTKNAGAVFFGVFIAYFFQNLFLFETPAGQFVFYLSAAWMLSYFPMRTRADSPAPIAPAVRTGINSALWFGVVLALYYTVLQPAREAVAVQKMRALPVQERASLVNKVFMLSPMGRAFDEARSIHESAERYLTKLPSYDTQARAVISEELKSYLAVIEQANDNGNLRHAVAGSAIANDIYAYSANKKTDVAYLQKAHEYARKAIERSPQNQIGYLEMAKAYVQAGNIPRAIAFLQMAVGLEPRAKDPHTVLLHLIQASGNESLFQKKMQEAQTAIPGFIYR